MGGAGGVIRLILSYVAVSATEMPGGTRANRPNLILVRIDLIMALRVYFGLRIQPTNATLMGGVRMVQQGA